MTVRRWRRYGADRIFVVAPTGSSIGSFDLISGRIDVADSGDEASVRLAVQEYLRGDSDEVLVPQQRSGQEQLSVADEAMLAAWLGTPIAMRGPGSRREVALRARLERLGDLGWTVLHAVPIGIQGSACAHVLLGPQGVFTVRRIGTPQSTIEIDGGFVAVDGIASSAMRDAALEARRVRSMLLAAGGHRVVVRSIVVAAGTLEIHRPGRESGPQIVGVDDLLSTLRNLPEVLRIDEYAALAQVARRVTTWLS